MTGDGAPPFSDKDIRTLAARLKGLHAVGSPGEQFLLHSALRLAASLEQEEADTTGQVWAVTFNPLTYLDAISRRMLG